MVELPRYKLGVGDRLRYRMSGEREPHGEGEGPTGQARFSIDWELFVVGRSAEGCWRLVFSESRTRQHESAAGQRTVSTVDQDGFFDIGAAGRLVENWTITPLANPSGLFPALPADEAEAERGWTSALQLDGARRRYVRSGVDAAARRPVWHIVEACQTELDPIYEVWRERRYAFEIARGLVTRVVTSWQRGWPAGTEPGSGTDSIDLAEYRPAGEAVEARAGEDADRYFERCAEYQRLIDLALWDARRSSAWLEEAGEVLEQTVPTLHAEFVAELLRRKLALHRRETGSLLSDAERLGGLIDRPLGDWQAVDLDGGAHSVKAYGGRALVLCFWNRGCTWSIRVLLALRALADELGTQPVAFLGINADGNAEDARLVWRTLDMAFPTVLDLDGCPMARSCGVDSYPTTVVIDPGGVVRRMRPGYSPRLTSLLALELAKLTHGEPCGCGDS